MHDFQSKLPRLPCTGRHFLFLILKMPDSAHLSWLLCNRGVRQPSKQALGSRASRQSRSQTARHPSNQASTHSGNRAHYAKTDNRLTADHHRSCRRRWRYGNAACSAAGRRSLRCPRHVAPGLVCLHRHFSAEHPGMFPATGE